MGITSYVYFIFYVCYSTSEEKSAWLSDITGCMALVREKYLVETGKIAPIWTPDSYSNNCTVCNAAFSMFFRRHHCRNCGKLVCDPCSSYRCMIPEVSDTEVRVCKSCHDELAEELEKDTGDESQHRSVGSASSAGGGFTGIMRRSSLLLGFSKEAPVANPDNKPKVLRRASSLTLSSSSITQGESGKTLGTVSELGEENCNADDDDDKTDELSSQHYPSGLSDITLTSSADISDQLGSSMSLTASSVEDNPTQATGQPRPSPPPPPPPPPPKQPGSRPPNPFLGQLPPRPPPPPPARKHDHIKKSCTEVSAPETSAEDHNSSDSEEETEKLRIMLKRRSMRRQSVEVVNNPLFKG